MYNHSSESSTATTTTTSTTTSLHFAAFGPRHAKRMRHLYEHAFPWAIGNCTKHDAIVMDASRHFWSNAIAIFKMVMDYIQKKSATSPASFCYMEPTPEEWPTSNGFWVEACWEKCACRALGDAALRGRATPCDPKVDLTRNDAKGKLDVPSFQDFVQLYSNNLTQSFTTDVDPKDVSCAPDCAPADWRVRFVRNKTLGADPKQHCNPPQKFQLVPTHWQLVGRSHHSSTSSVRDCTHRAFDALFMMNEQLMRSMMCNQKGQASTLV